MHKLISQNCGDRGAPRSLSERAVTAPLTFEGKVGAFYLLSLLSSGEPRGLRWIGRFPEAACNVRYFEQEQICKDGDPRSKTYGQVIDRWTSTHSVQVKPMARHFGNCAVAEYVIDSIYDVRDLEYLLPRARC